MWELPPPGLESQFKRWYWWATHSRLKRVVKAAKTLKRHLEGIVNAVLHGIANALTEGLNSKIEAIKRNAAGSETSKTFERLFCFIAANWT